jgi:type IV pilus assembly protein PilE
LSKLIFMVFKSRITSVLSQKGFGDCTRRIQKNTIQAQGGSPDMHAGLSLKRTCHGWTLAELLIGLALMSLLMALAFPAYQQQQRQARRSDGHTALLQLQMDQARWRSQHEEFANTPRELGWTSELSAKGHYRIVITQASADGYTAQALATGGQAGDQPCAVMRLRWQGSAQVGFSSGETGDGDPHRCWQR